MDHQSPDILPSVELPSPQQGPQPQDYEVDKTYNEQQSSKRLEQPVQVTPSAPSAQPVDVLMGQIVSPHDPPPAGIPGVVPTPQIADDGDLIEKEWVDRAKRIVEHTKHDPHLQNKEMNTMKADYLKKRYNKDIKLSE